MKHKLDNIQDQKLADKINQLIKEITPKQSAWVRSVIEEFDEDGNSRWVIDLYFELSDVPIETQDNAKLTFKIREFLFSRGDTRFPYIYHNLPENQPVASAC